MTSPLPVNYKELPKALQSLHWIIRVADERKGTGRIPPCARIGHKEAREVIAYWKARERAIVDRLKEIEGLSDKGAIGHAIGKLIKEMEKDE